MKIDRFIEPIFAYCAAEYNCIRIYSSEKDVKKIIAIQDKLVSNNVLIHQQSITKNVVALVDLDLIIKVLYAFRVAITEVDNSFGESDFHNGWTPVYEYFNLMEKLFEDNIRVEKEFGMPGLINDYSLKKTIEAIRKIANQFIVESGNGPFSSRARMNKRGYRKQAQALIEIMSGNGIRNTNKTNIYYY